MAVDSPLYEVVDEPENKVLPPPSQVILPEVKSAVTVVQPLSQSTVQQFVSVANPVVSQPQLTDVPDRFRCLNCQMDVITVTRFLADPTITCNMCGSHCSMTVWPCCLEPCKSCQDVEHSCPMCKSVLFIYKRV